jgi:hypothetical protein
MTRQPGYTCAVCGEQHDELPTCFISPEPFYLGSIPDDERARRVEQSSDQCVVDGENFFILGNLDVAIRGVEEPLRWTLWTTLSEKNFRRATDLWETAGREQEPPYFGWLSTRIPGYPDTLSLKTVVHTQPVGVRPLVEVLEQDHELFRDQRDGVSLDRAWALIHAALHGAA